MKSTHSHTVCSIIPPHILQSIAERGDHTDRERAHVALELSAAFRGERRVIASGASLLAVPAGQKRRTVFSADNTTNLPGRLVRGEDGPSTGDAAVDEAYAGAGLTYDFYNTVFNRNSIDDRGLRIDSTVHYGAGYDNALWNGQQMIYGDGEGRRFHRFTLALDVIGHELTHGLTQSTANLQYQGQSGALNEHFSDVFGSLVKQHAAGQTAAQADWLIGQGLFTNQVQGIAVRSMKAPGTAYDDPVLGRDPQPDRMSNFVQTTDDFGGVHINSGIPNRAFYLVAMKLGGYAWEHAGHLWYVTLTEKLGPTATFQECADATYETAGQLFDGKVQQMVYDAWTEVEITISDDVVNGQSMMLRQHNIPEWVPTWEETADASYAEEAG